jgi:hypothetical protein
MNRIIIKKTILFAVFFFFAYQIQAQYNLPYNALPFLNMEANAQSIGSGLMGVVAPDIYSDNGLNQNPAHLSRGRKGAGVRINYHPFTGIYSDFKMFEGGGYFAFNEKNALGASVKYFKPGKYSHINYQPYELSASLRYAHSFTENLSLGTAVKNIFSFCFCDYESNSTIVKTRTPAVDFGIDYRRHFNLTENTRMRWNTGLSVLNIGSKLDYGTRKEFLPATLRLGSMATFGFTSGNAFKLALDAGYQFERLLVPTPPAYKRDQYGQPLFNSDGRAIIEKGYDPDVSVMRGIFQSFYDAPGGLLSNFLFTPYYHLCCTR